MKVHNGNRRMSSCRTFLWAGVSVSTRPISVGCVIVPLEENMAIAHATVGEWAWRITRSSLKERKNRCQCHHTVNIVEKLRSVVHCEFFSALVGSWLRIFRSPKVGLASSTSVTYLLVCAAVPLSGDSTQRTQKRTLKSILIRCGSHGYSAKIHALMITM